MPLNHATVVLLFLIAYTTVWPAIFEWYTLLNTFPGLAGRYSNGPKIALSGKLLLWGGFLLIFAVVFFPYPLFWAMWVGPLAIFSGQLIRKGIWNPFTAMAEGNWGPALLVAIGVYVTGFSGNCGIGAATPIRHYRQPTPIIGYTIFPMSMLSTFLPKCRCWDT